jgi:hypothetical protein
VTAADLAELEQLRTLAQGDTAMAIAFMSALDEHAEELLRLARVGLAAETGVDPEPVEGAPC